MVLEHFLPTDDATALIERLTMLPAGLKSASDSMQADLLFARVASLTDALRGAGSNETARLAARLLLADLCLVSTRFRGQTTALDDMLTRAHDGLAAACAHAS